MITFNYETDFSLENESAISEWISSVIKKEGYNEGAINFIFCDDAYLYTLNVSYLNHDTYTDIISFDYTEGKTLQGDVFISTERVAENALKFGVEKLVELLRVMVHGILHYCGFKDKSKQDKLQMRERENLHLRNAPKI